MKWLIWMFLVLPIFAQESNSTHAVDYEARKEISELKARVSTLEQRHNDLKELIQEGIDETKQLNNKVNRLIYGTEGTGGIQRNVALNSEFRDKIEKFIFVLITAIVGQLVLFIGAILKIRKLINLVK